MEYNAMPCSNKTCDSCSCSVENFDEYFDLEVLKKNLKGYANFISSVYNIPALYPKDKARLRSVIIESLIVDMAEWDVIPKMDTDVT
jgi:hypothetical protein